MEDWEFQYDAKTFIRMMLNDMKELLPYGNLKYREYTQTFSPEPLPESFNILMRISREIPSSPPHDTPSFFEIFKEVAMFQDQRVPLEQWPTYISLFIKHLENSIVYVRDPSQEIIQELFAPDPQSRTTRRTTQQSTWKSHAKDWGYAIEKWIKFLNLFNRVYGFVLQNDFMNALITLVQYSPSCKLFWQCFWHSLVFSGNTEVQSYPTFQQFLNREIIPCLIHPDNPQRDVQLSYCRRGLQHTVEELEDYIQQNNYPYDTVFDGRLLLRESVNEALLLTGITLMPHASLIGEECRQIANYQNSREMAVHNNSVYFC